MRQMTREEVRSRDRVEAHRSKKKRVDNTPMFHELKGIVPKKRGDSFKESFKQEIKGTQADRKVVRNAGGTVLDKKGNVVTIARSDRQNYEVKGD